MIKVNIKTFECSREDIPSALQGLSNETLTNLQTELNPVPDEFKDIEYWPEIDVTPFVDITTQVCLDTETLEINKVAKIVKVLKGFRDKTTEELNTEFKKTVPTVISKRQARRALLDAGLLADIETAIINSNDEVLKIDWIDATEIRRDWQNLITMSTSLGITERQLDELFIAANSF